MKNTRNPNFNSKAEYLAYRKAWKADYKALSQEIRDLKAEIRSQRGIESSQFYSLRGLKTTATCMLEERKSAKQQAQEQYLAEKAKLAAA